MVSKAGAASPTPHGVEEKRLARVRAIAELRHPHLIVMRELDDGGYVAEIGSGLTLGELQEARGPLPLRVSLRILLDAMSGLSALHRARIGAKTLDFVHGELTPDNIVIGTDGAARLVPLVESHWLPGASAAAEASGYTAPEKLLGDAFDQRADVFSAGVLLWEAMMGRPLFRGSQVDDIVTQLVGGKVPYPAAAGEDAEWSADLADVVMRALAVDPQDRWAHVGIMGADIETIAEGRMAKSIDLVVLVTGREVSRDSLSDEVTRPLASIASLTPFANSIPVLDEPTSPASPEAMGMRRSDSSEIITAVRTPVDLHPPMPERRRWAIVAGALSFSILLLAVAGMKTLGQKPDASVSTVLAMPAAQPSVIETPTVAQPEESAPLATVTTEPATIAPPPPKAAPLAPVTPAPKPMPKAAPPNAEAKPPRVAPKAAPPSTKSKAKDDPFGLSRPVRTKPKDDQFGL
jgi:serine/threonine-protein kinase